MGAFSIAGCYRHHYHDIPYLCLHQPQALSWPPLPLAAIADNPVPVAIYFILVNGGNLKRECLVMLERRSSIETEAQSDQQPLC
jgi:hypothetical protein